MSIENPTLAHFRHFIRRGGFSSLFTHLPSTSVENPLQISSFMQNKPNFRKSQMNANSCASMDYENISDWTLGQSKPNSNPISSKAQMNVNSLITKDYIKYDDFAVPKNKPNQTQFLWIPAGVYPARSLSLTEFIPHFYAGMRGCGGRNDNAGG